jgi:hypothetical protein
MARFYSDVRQKSQLIKQFVVFRYWNIFLSKQIQSNKFSSRIPIADILSLFARTLSVKATISSLGVRISEFGNTKYSMTMCFSKYFLYCVRCKFVRCYIIKKSRRLFRMWRNLA